MKDLRKTIGNSGEQKSCDYLLNHGFESAGCESLYSGVTGERIEAEIFVGVAYYQKLHNHNWH